MSSQQTQITDHSVETPSGRISYATAGTGPVALFVALYGTVVVYSGTSRKPAMVSNPEIIFQSQSVRGFGCSIGSSLQTPKRSRPSTKN
jgi:hypothetical protein